MPDDFWRLLAEAQAANSPLRSDEALAEWMSKQTFTAQEQKEIDDGVERLRARLKKRAEEWMAKNPPKKGEFPDKSVNGCKCPCHREIAEDGTGWPCGYDECGPCHVEPK